LYRVSAQGGAAVATNVTYGRFPQFLPDGRHFLYFRPGVSASRGIYVADLQGADGHRITETEAAATFASSGHLLFARQGVLFAQTFDVGTLNVSGDPFPLAKGVFVNGPFLNAPVSTSRAGPIVYRTTSAGGLRQFTWFDRQGRVLSRVGEPTENLLQPELSPDGRRLVIHRLLNANTDIWVMDVDRGVLSRVTSSPLTESSPIWSPDGNRLVISSTGNLHLVTLGGSDLKEDVLLETSHEKWATDWSRDGEYVLYVERGNQATGRDLWVLPLHDRKPIPIAQTAADDEDGQFSPDGRWIVYQSTESGRMEVYVVPFRRSGRKLQISSSGGVQARWSRDGSELFYVDLDGKLIDVTLTADANDLRVSDAKPLFATHIGDPLEGNMRRGYVVSADNQRFLVNTLSETVMPMTVLLNWRPSR
jgi:Tol biopolymer transport system component